MALDSLTDTRCVYQGCNNRITHGALLTHMHCNKHAEMRCATCCHPLFEHTHGMVCPGDYTASYFFKEDKTGNCGQTKKRATSAKQKPTAINIPPKSHLPQSDHHFTSGYSNPGSTTQAPKTSIRQSLRSMASAAVAFTQIVFSALLMLAIGSGVVYGGVILGQWLAYEVMLGIVPNLTALSFIYLTPILTFAPFVIYVMPFIWNRVGNSRRFAWSGRISEFIAILAEYTRLTIATIFILISGYIIFWGAVWSGNWLASGLLNIDFISYTIVQLVPYTTPIIGFIVLALYIAPWIWDRITGRGIPQWTTGAREFTWKTVKRLLAVLLILIIIAIALAIISN